MATRSSGLTVVGALAVVQALLGIFTGVVLLELASFFHRNGQSRNREH